MYVICYVSGRKISQAISSHNNLTSPFLAWCQQHSCEKVDMSVLLPFLGVALTWVNAKSCCISTSKRSFAVYS